MKDSRFIRRIFISLIICTIWAGEIQAQERGHFSPEQRRQFGGMITGMVFDASEKNPMQYANIVLFRQDDKKQVTGAISDTDGKFAFTGVMPGVYYAEISFMGFKTEHKDNIEINPRNFRVDLGKIFLEQKTVPVEGMVVTGERPPVAYEIDRKVINVSQMKTGVEGTAVDILADVPSVSVDLEGNVSLRGSTNFTVLIDSRPSLSDANDALQQIPAGAIENIEIITNPSAKYDPEGTAGIINIILKKKKLEGSSGMVDLSGGFNDKYGGNFLFQHKDEKYTLTLGFDKNRRFFKGENKVENRTTENDTVSYLYSKGSSRMGRMSTGFQGAVEYKFGPSDIVTLNTRYNDRKFDRSSKLDYTEWKEPDTTTSRVYYKSSSDSDRGGSSYSANLSYLHKFEKKDNELSAEFLYSHEKSDDRSTNELLNSGEGIEDGKKSVEAGPSDMLNLKIDYQLPFDETRKFEGGYQFRMRDADESTEYYEYVDSLGYYVFFPEFSYSIKNIHNTHSIYSLYSGKWRGAGYKLGLRGEYTYRRISLLRREERFIIDQFDYFPTLHLSYSFRGLHQLMMSYARRINHPRGWELEPFQTWMDAFNIHEGNPALKPEYIDSYEAGYQTEIKDSFISLESYYRVTHNVIEDVQSIYSPEVFLHSVENIGASYDLGSELTWRFDFRKKLKLSLIGNLFDHRIKGTLFGEDFSRQSTNWEVRMNGILQLRKTTQVSVNGMYESPSVSSQGSEQGFVVTDAAIRQDFFDKKLSVTLQVRDIFGTGQHESTSEGAGFSSYRLFTREARVVMLNIKLNINNFKSEQRQRESYQENVTEEGDYE